VSRLPTAPWSPPRISRPTPLAVASLPVPRLLATSDVLGTGWFGADAAHVQPGSTVAIVSDGAVGLCAVIAAKHMGAERIIMMSRHEARQQLAREFGATDIVTERGDEGVARIKAMTGGLGAHSVVEAVGTQKAMMQAIHSTRPGGYVGFVGVSHGVEFPGEELFFAEVHLLGGPAPVRRFLPELIDLVWNGKINPGKVFDLTLPLDQVGEGYRAMDARRAIKTLLRPCGASRLRALMRSTISSTTSIPASWQGKGSSPMRRKTPGISPLNALLAATLADLAREFAAASARHRSRIPTFAIYANLLSHVADDGVARRDLPARARLSKRAVAFSVGVAQRWGWVAATGSAGAMLVLLTTEGRRQRDACAQQLAQAEHAWRARLGDDVVTAARVSLESLVSQLDLELPHFPAGYGPADASVTGGVCWGRPARPRCAGAPELEFDAAEERRAPGAWEAASGGALDVSSAGQDWKPVLRGEGDSVTTLPLSALLSEALMAFTIDYEGSGGLSLAAAASVVRHLHDDGVDVALRARRGKEPGPPIPAPPMLSMLQRHAYAAVEANPDQRNGRFRLTEKGRQVRDAYEPLLAAVEQQWERRYGTLIVHGVRASLQAVAGQLDGDLPHDIIGLDASLTALVTGGGAREGASRNRDEA
jgi:hypothetical protein